MTPRWRWCQAIEEAGGLQPSLWIWVERPEDLPAPAAQGAWILGSGCGCPQALAAHFAGRPQRLLTHPGSPRQRCREYRGQPVQEQEWLLLVGEASGANRWEQRPLYGLCLWLTRHPSQLEPLQSRLQQLGAEVVSFPVLEFAAPSRPELLERALQQLPDYHWVLFTSPNGVDRFFTALWQSGGDPRRLAQARLGVIGPGTARALEQRGLRADVVAPRAIAEGLLEALGEDQVRGRRVLLARAEEARDVLPEGLRERGATVEVVPCYRTIRPCGPPTVGPGASPDWVVLMSASAARHFAQLYPARPLPPALCIGPITAEEAVRQGYPRWETADQHHVEGVVDKLLQIVAPRHR